MTNVFQHWSTMKDVAELSGEEKTNHPKTACAVAANPVLTIETFTNREEQQIFRAAVPFLEPKRTLLPSHPTPEITN